MMNASLERRVLGLIGLGIRARSVVVGVEQVRVAARRGRLSLAVVAADASAHSRSKVLPLLDARRLRVVEVPSAAALGAAAGRDAAAAVGILDAALARGIRALVSPHEGRGNRRERNVRTSRVGSAKGNGAVTVSPVSRRPSPVRS